MHDSKLPRESSDAAVLDLLRKTDAQTVGDLARSMGVTATAVRQRLNRLMGQELVEREVSRHGRGRPSHRYRLTAKGRRKTGTNFADLAVVLWKEVRSVKDDEVRRGLLRRLASSLAKLYGDELHGEDAAQRMHSIRELFAQRSIPFTVDESSDLPVLTAEACPYPDLAEQDRSICSMERMLFSELLDEDVRLSECRLDGGSCCTFEMS